MAPRTLEPLPWQAQSLLLRTNVDLLIACGGRAGGKSTAAKLHLLAHCNDLGEHAAPVVVREAFAPLGEFLVGVHELAAIAYGTAGLSYNKADATITLPTGGTIYGASLHEGEASYVRWQGRNLTAIFGEELSNFKAHQFALLRRLESNLRPPKGYKAERFFTANPGGVGSAIIFRNWLSKCPPWRMGRDHHGLTYVWMPSIYTDNTHIDHAQYKRNLRASVGSDEALLEAWLNGRWDSIGGLMFPINPEVHILPPLPVWMAKKFGKFHAAADWGNGAPATFGLMCQLREPINWQGRRFPYGSIIQLEEYDTAIDDNDLTVGSGLDARSFAEGCRALLVKWGAEKCPVVVDDAKGLQGDSVVDYFRDVGLRASKPHKGSRVEGWDILRQHLAEAVKEEGRPGLYFTTLCPHTIQTLSEAPRGLLNPRDLDPKWSADHWADMCRYNLNEIAGGPRSHQAPVVGTY